jgi:hypothetical protein
MSYGRAFIAEARRPLGGSSVRRTERISTTGHANRGRIIAAAAGIMILVFGSFVYGSGDLKGKRLS